MCLCQSTGLVPRICIIRMIVVLAIIQTSFQMSRVNVMFALNLAGHWMKFYQVLVSGKKVSLRRLLGLSKEAELYTEHN